MNTDVKVAGTPPALQLRRNRAWQTPRTSHRRNPRAPARQTALDRTPWMPATGTGPLARRGGKVADMQDHLQRGASDDR